MLLSWVQGLTALHYATCAGFKVTADILLSAGASVDAQDDAVSHLFSKVEQHMCSPVCT